MTQSDFDSSSNYGCQKGNSSDFSFYDDRESVLEKRFTEQTDDRRMEFQRHADAIDTATTRQSSFVRLDPRRGKGARNIDFTKAENRVEGSEAIEWLSEPWRNQGTWILPRNLGTVCGAGLLVIDNDPDAAEYDDRVVSRLKDHGLHDTHRVTTPHSGAEAGHFYYAVSPDIADTLQDAFGTRNPDGAFGEVFAENQYVVSPGSVLWDCDHGCCSSENPGWYRVVGGEVKTLSDDLIIDILDADPELDSSATASTPTRDFEIEQTTPSSVSLPEAPPSIPDDSWAKIETATEWDSKMAALWEFAKGDIAFAVLSSRIDELYTSKRSSAVVALAQKLCYYLGDIEISYAILEELQPPRWENESHPWKESVMDSAAQLSIRQNEVFDWSENSESPSLREREYRKDVTRETAAEIRIAILAAGDGQDEFRTKDVRYELQQMFDRDLSAAHVRKILNHLRGAGYLSYDDRGRAGGFWVKRYEGTIFDSETESELFLNKFNTHSEVWAQRREFLQGEGVCIDSTA